MRQADPARPAGLPPAGRPPVARPPRIRALREDDDLEAELDLAHRAFGPVSDAALAGWRDGLLPSVADGRILGVFDGPALVGTARFHDMRQWWHGRSLPMAGVAGVKIAPEERGRGTGRALMTELLRLIAGRGYPLSALFPSTAPFYRSLGWEVAGGIHLTTLPVLDLTRLQAPEADPAPGLAGQPGPPARSAVRRAGPDDAATVIEVLGRAHRSALDCGPNTRDAASVRHWLRSETSMFSYLAEDGFLAYGWNGGHEEIMIRQLVASSAGTARTLWGIVASHATMATTVRAILGPRDPVTWLTREPQAEPAVRHWWMLRVIDAVAAIAGRGFPAAVALSVPLRLTDTVLAANSGLWRLEVSGGQAALTPFETKSSSRLRPAAPVRLGPRGFAALYAGTPLATLRLAGLAADGDPAADAALDSAFAATPYMIDHF